VIVYPRSDSTVFPVGELDTICKHLSNDIPQATLFAYLANDGNCNTYSCMDSETGNYWWAVDLSAQVEKGMVTTTSLCSNVAPLAPSPTGGGGQPPPQTPPPRQFVPRFGKASEILVAADFYATLKLSSWLLPGWSYIIILCTRRCFTNC